MKMKNLKPQQAAPVQRAIMTTTPQIDNGVIPQLSLEEWLAIVESWGIGEP